MLELFYSFLGILFGILCGVIPGLHINTLLSFLELINADPFLISITVVAMASSYSVFEVVRSIFLSVPDDSVVAVLPGHRMLLEGKGAYALKLCAVSSLLAVILSAIISPLLFFFLPPLFILFKPFVPWIVLAATVFLVFYDASVYSIVVFILSGILGLVVLDGSLVKEPLFPSFTGLFATSSLLMSIAKNEKIPSQKKPEEVMVSSIFGWVLLGVLLGMLADFLPAIGTPAQLATLASPFVILNPPAFLSMTTAINVSHTLFSFVFEESVGVARTGSAIFVKSLGVVDFGLMPMVGVFMLSSSVSIALLIFLADRVAHLCEGTDSRILSGILFVYLIVVVLLISGPYGLLILATSTAIGLLALVGKVRRTNLMGILLMPTLLNMFGLTWVALLV
ncbi:MAG: tripartite tricarboxylate transporter permease [Candidatus Micrarchaeia archaeon]